MFPRVFSSKTRGKVWRKVERGKLESSVFSRALSSWMIAQGLPPKLLMVVFSAEGGKLGRSVFLRVFSSRTLSKAWRECCGIFYIA